MAESSNYAILSRYYQDRSFEITIDEPTKELRLILKHYPQCASVTIYPSDTTVKDPLGSKRKVKSGIAAVRKAIDVLSAWIDKPPESVVGGTTRLMPFENRAVVVTGAGTLTELDRNSLFLESIKITHSSPIGEHCLFMRSCSPTYHNHLPGMTIAIEDKPRVGLIKQVMYNWCRLVDSSKYDPSISPETCSQLGDF